MECTEHVFLKNKDFQMTDEQFGKQEKGVHFGCSL